MAEPFNTPVPGATPVPGGTPIPASTPRSASPIRPTPSDAAAPGKPIVLHIGDEVRYNPATYAEFTQAFDVVRPSTPERQRPAFREALASGRWGAFSAIFRPFWGSGGEMGRWDDGLIDLLPASCRVFASAGAGFDWADTEALGKKGIIYCNSGLAAAEAVSDFAVAMVISTFRHLPWCINAATAGGHAAAAASPAEADALFEACHHRATAQSYNLRNHVLGIVGLGNVGQALAAKLCSAAFGMRLHYHDVQRKPAAVEQALAGGAGVVFHATLEGLLAAADCVVLCAPAPTDGRPLLTRAVLAHAKQHPVPARLVNVARGCMVDEEALADALEAGRLSAAALDVHAAEPRVHPRLLALATAQQAAGGRTVPAPVLLTCHNAGGTVDTHAGFEELSMRNILAVLGGQDAITPVNMHHVQARV